MDYLTAFSIIALAALIHASFQLGISMVTLLSGHAAGKRVSGNRTLRLVGAFFGGTVVMTTLLVSFLAYLGWSLFHRGIPVPVWSVVTGFLIGIGVVVWAYYYRRGQGTALWLPRGLATFITSRIKATSNSAESFSLGLTSVITELLFILPPALAATLSIISLPLSLQLYGVLLYVAVASLGMFVVTVLIGSGHSLSRIQRWREHNKRFLQFAAGSALVILGGYLYVNQVIAVSVVLLPGGGN